MISLNNAFMCLGPSWNVIVGKNFGSHVVHQTKSYLFASYGDDEIYILVWKAG
jgi:dynein light chain LC8-type